MGEGWTERDAREALARWLDLEWNRRTRALALAVKHEGMSDETFSRLLTEIRGAEVAMVRASGLLHEDQIPSREARGR